MALPTLTAADLAAFHGTAHWYRHGVIRNVLYTEGAKYVADQAGAYWLLDAIAIAQAWRPPGRRRGLAGLGAGGS